MALTVRERTGHRGVNRHRYVHLPVQERGHDRQNSHMGFLLFIFLPIAGCIYAIAHLLAPYHDSFVDDVFGGTPTPARPWEHNSATSVNWYFPGWSFTTHTIRNRYGMSTASAYRLNDPISVLPRVGGASPGGDLWKRDFCYTTAEPSHTSQHLHPAPAQHHTHQQPMATALSSNSHGSKMRTIVHDDWVM